MTRHYIIQYHAINDVTMYPSDFGIIIRAARMLAAFTPRRPEKRATMSSQQLHGMHDVMCKKLSARDGCCLVGWESTPQDAWFLKICLSSAFPRNRDKFWDVSWWKNVSRESYKGH